MTDPHDRPDNRPDTGNRPRHVSVLLGEVLETLAPQDGETYIDCTFGAGGYTRAILERASCQVLAIEQDPEAFFAGDAIRQEFAPRLILVSNQFSRMEREAGKAGLGLVDGIVMDIGVSSMQLDDAARGFSFLRDGPLDMRMSQEGPSAASFVNQADEEEIADVLYEFGEAALARHCEAIVKQRAERPLSRTLELAQLVERVLGRARGDEKHPATRTFQALRIHVNDELGELSRGLAAAERLLKPGGRLVVVTFHSLEDRIVKRFFTQRAGKEANVSRYLPPDSTPARSPSFRLVNTRGLTPSDGELDVNPRARSARLRAGIRTDAPAWPSEVGDGRAR